jgi:hypothetical protein
VGIERVSSPVVSLAWLAIADDSTAFAVPTRFEDMELD